MKRFAFILTVLFLLTLFKASAFVTEINDTIPPVKGDCIREAYWDSLFSLPTVQVIAKYSERLPNGGRIVHVQGNPLAKGRLIEDFMNMIQGVSFTNDDLTIEGEKCSVIEIDGRAADIKELRSLPLSFIDKIEANPTKDVEYGIDRGGIIRVTLRKFGGLLGQASGGVTFDDHGFMDAQARTNVLYRKGRHSFYGSASFQIGDQYFKYRRTEYGADAPPNDFLNINKSKGDNYDFIPSYRYSFNDYTWIDIFSKIKFGTNKEEQISESDDSYLDAFQKQNVLNYSAGASFVKYFNTEGANGQTWMKHKFSYSGSNSPTKETFTQTAESHARQKQRSNQYSLQSTFNFALPKGQSLQTGFEASLLNDYNTREDIQDQSSLQLSPTRYRLRFAEMNPYAEYTCMLKDVFLAGRLYYRFGRREFKDRLNSENGFSHNISSPDISANLNWTIDGGKGRSLRLWYLRIQYTPNYGFYSPIRNYISENLYTSGNPHLKDEVYRQIGVTYNLNSRWYIRYNTVFGSRLVQLATSRDANNTDLYCTRPENIGEQWHHQFNINYSGFVIKNVWYMSPQLRLSYIHETLDGQTLNNPQCEINMYNNFVLSGNIRLSLGLTGYTKQKHLSFDREPRMWLNPGISFSLLKNQLNINLNSMIYVTGREKVTFKGDDFSFVRKRLNSSNMYFITFSWNFHAGKQIQQIQIENSNDISRDKPKL